MEKEFHNFRKGETKSPKYLNKYEKQLLDMGILIIEDRIVKVNPLISKCASLNNAKSKLEKIANNWLDKLQEHKDNILDLRFDMVEFFKNNPIEDFKNSTALFPDNTPEEYTKTGEKGTAYIFNNNIIAIHHGFSAPDNAPEGCSKYSYTSYGNGIKMNEEI